MGVSAVATSGPALGVPAGFVTRSGDQLLLDGEPYLFTGLNVYNANSRGWCWYDMVSGSVLDDSIVEMGPGAKVIRAWFFQTQATTGGVRDWSAFDHTLAVAAARGVKVIPTLANQWADCEPSAGYKTRTWYETGYTQPDPGGTVSYRDFVSEIVTRYAADPTIMAWQLINEAQVKDTEGGGCSTNAATILRNWASDVSGLIKSIDPDHLVSIGTIGTGQCGASTSEYQTLHALSTVDLCEFHDYGSPLVPIPGDIWNGMQVRLNQCAALDKPLFVGETGIIPNTVGGTLQARADAFEAKFDAQLAAGVVGELVWNWNASGSLLDNYDVGPSDPTLGVLDDLLPDPQSPRVEVGDASVLEGDSGGDRVVKIPVTLSEPSTTQVDVTYTLAAGTAGAPADFNDKNGTPRLLKFKVGGSGLTATRKWVAVKVHPDTSPEPDETFTVTLSSPTAGYTLGRSVGTGTIIDDDPTAGLEIGIGDAAIVEGDTGKARKAAFTVTLSATSGSPVTVDYIIASGTAAAPADFDDRGNKIRTLTINPGKTRKFVNVPVKPDTGPEADETYTVTLSNPTGATITRSVGTGTILDEDTP